MDCALYYGIVYFHQCLYITASDALMHGQPHSNQCRCRGVSQLRQVGGLLEVLGPLSPCSRENLSLCNVFSHTCALVIQSTIQSRRWAGTNPFWQPRRVANLQQSPLTPTQELGKLVHASISGPDPRPMEVSFGWPR